MWAPLLALQVSSTGVAVLLFSLFSPRLALFSSLSVLHTCKAGECGSGRMTHLLHTSSLLGLIWAARKSILLRLCSGEEQAMQGHYEDLFSTFSFLLHCFSEHGPLIWAPRCLYYHKDKILVPLLHGYFMAIFRCFGRMIEAQMYAYAWNRCSEYRTCTPSRSVSHVNTHGHNAKLSNPNHSIH